MAGDGPSFLETPSYWVTLVIAVFLVLSTAFEKILAGLNWFLRKRKREYLIAAVDNMKSELMLLGFISLILVAFENNIGRLCVKAPSTTAWTLVDHLSDCPCCLAHTRHVSACYLAYERCGTAFCNCAQKNETCLVSETGSYSGSAPAPSKAAASGGHRHLLAGEVASAEAAHCKGPVQDEYAECDYRPGYRPAVSVELLHQVHLLIFLVAIVHISCAVVMYIIASWRLRIWRRWRDEDDKHSRAVRAALQSHEERSCRIVHGHAYLTGADGVARHVSAAEGIALADRVMVVDEDGREVVLEVGHADDGAPVMAEPHAAAAAVPEAGSDRLGKVLAAGQPEGVQPAAAAALVGPAAVVGKGEAAAALGPADCSQNGGVGAAAPHGARLPALPDVVHVDRTKKWLGRSKSMKEMRTHEHGWEWVRCFLRQFWVHTVPHEEFSILRASFLLTHRVGRKFDFMNYILTSMEDDFAHVVGLGLEVWSVIIFFVFLAGPFGWPAWPVTLAVIAVMLIVNTKLAQIVRHTTRGGAAHRLAPNIFWFKKPWLLLPVIKLLLFTISFIFTATIFFASQFGTGSCFFATNRDSFLSHGIPLPTWLLLLCNGAVFLGLSFVTLPLYSLAVQMGSDFKHHMLPATVKDRLLGLAASARRRTKEAQPSRAQAIQEKVSQVSGAVSRLTAGSLSSGSTGQGSQPAPPVRAANGIANGYGAGDGPEAAAPAPASDGLAAGDGSTHNVSQA